MKKKIAKFFIESNRRDGPKPISLLNSDILDFMQSNFEMCLES